MDNPTSESTGELNTETAVDAFAALLNPEPVEKVETPDPEVTEVEAEAVEPEPAAAEDEPTFTVKIDGKEVEIPLSELKNGYQRQTDYTRKTMEAAEQRKAADAELTKAQQERATYAENLQRMRAVDEAALEQQKNVNWDELLQTDPVEYLKQQRIANERQARLQQVYSEQQRLTAQQQAEQAEAKSRYVAQQHEELIAKLPEWKDATKAAAEKQAIASYLIETGFDQDTVNNITDARAVVMARKAMLFDRMMQKASAASKKVATLPQKVERPGQGDNPGLDKRSSAFQKLSKSGRVEDAAALFSQFV